MPEDKIILVEETEPERRPVPFFKIAAVTTTIVLIHRNLKHRRIVREEKRKAEAMDNAVDSIMNKYNPFHSVSPEDIIESTATEID